MLNFINENDFLLVDKYKQNDDGSVGWIYKDGDATHSGFIREGMTRTIQVPDGAESVKTGHKEVLDTNGEPLLDKEGMPVLEDVYEEQPKYKTETVDIWAKFQALVSNGAIILETEHLLLEQKIRAQAAINSERDLIHGSGIEYNGHTFQTDAQSISDIMGAIVTDTDTVWLTTDNYQVDMAIEDMKALGLAIANRKKFLVYKAREFKDAVEALTSEQEINEFISNLDWSA
ncbi:DUF4376 domain-containing protein [Pseudoalteromonas agarivorans]|uniref:DUF4376 domain-containing protein n=1 Tax=Pseudoalteromonas agarivorans TaxID=176102 RepID=UPI002117D5C6|nr:DUF4376 domain-containing protein [Pseudoalteromonas agarivorans]MCQ8884466.1 DUF4376 domain-containing protein [Pseudoalteromonas agarivorans]